jgi:hypothetical protein
MSKKKKKKKKKNKTKNQNESGGQGVIFLCEVKPKCKDITKIRVAQNMGVQC